MRVEGLNKKYFKEILTPTVGDPLEMLMQYAKNNNLRILDLFVRLDTDKSCTISYDEFRTGIAVSLLPHLPMHINKNDGPKIYFNVF